MQTPVEQMVDEIREWELEHGGGFTDYFLDKRRYEAPWLEFLESKGYHELVQEIKEDVYVCHDGTVLGCTDQGLLYEPHITAHCYGEEEEKPWEEDVYRMDVALWAEFILGDIDVLIDYRNFMVGVDD